LIGATIPVADRADDRLHIGAGDVLHLDLPELGSRGLESVLVTELGDLPYVVTRVEPALAQIVEGDLCRLHELARVLVRDDLCAG